MTPSSSSSSSSSRKQRENARLRSSTQLGSLLLNRRAIRPPHQTSTRNSIAVLPHLHSHSAMKGYGEFLLVKIPDARDDSTHRCRIPPKTSVELMSIWALVASQMVQAYIAYRTLFSDPRRLGPLGLFTQFSIWPVIVAATLSSNCARGIALSGHFLTPFANEGQAVQDEESANKGEVTKDEAEVNGGEVVRERVKVIEGKIGDGIIEGDDGESGTPRDEQKLEPGKAIKPEEAKLTKAAKKMANGKAYKKAEEEKNGYEDQVLEEAMKAKQTKTLAQWKENTSTKSKND